MRPVFISFGIAFVLIWGYLWLPQSTIGINFSRSHPVWAWTHGTPEMQQAAARVLEQSIKPGSDAKTAIRILSPGSLNRREMAVGDFSGEGAIGFNIRTEYNFGLDLHYRDGKVVSVRIYD